MYLSYLPVAFILNLKIKTEAAGEYRIMDRTIIHYQVELYSFVWRLSQSQKKSEPKPINTSLDI